VPGQPSDRIRMPVLHKAVTVVCNHMRKLLSILSVLTLSLSSCGQNFKEFSFADIGLHIKMPDNYVFQEDFPKPSFLDEQGKQITDTAKLKALEADLMKGLLIVSSTDGSNTASFNLAMQTAKTGDFELYYNFLKNMQQLMAKQQMTNYDTASSVLTVDNIKVHKFLTYTVKTIPALYSGIYIAKMKEYFLIIKADYTDKKFGDDIEKAILTSKSD
jgi:hypothetical protein